MYRHGVIGSGVGVLADAADDGVRAAPAATTCAGVVGMTSGDSAVEEAASTAACANDRASVWREICSPGVCASLLCVFGVALTFPPRFAVPAVSCPHCCPLSP